MRLRWLVDARDVVLLALLALTSLGLATFALAAIYSSRQHIKHAITISQRADSLVRDWTRRGCAPRTQTLP